MAGLIEKFPEKERDIVRHLGDNVSVLINKGCYNHSLVHTVIYNYIQVRQRMVLYIHNITYRLHSSVSVWRLSSALFLPSAFTHPS